MLSLAEKHQLNKVYLPPIGTGNCGYKNSDIAYLIKSTVNSYAAKKPNSSIKV